MFKKVLKNLLKVSAVLAASFLMAGCANNLLDSDNSSSAGYASLVVGVDSQERYVDVSSIKFAKVVVSGNGIAGGSEPYSDFGSVANGKADCVTVKNIPVGKNRIVTVYAYDSSKEQLTSVVLRAVTDISSGENSIVVNKKSTALGNIFDSLHKAGAQVSSINKDVFVSVTDDEYALVNTSKIASDYMTSPESLGVKSDYALETAVLSYKSNISGEITIQVYDPLSSIKANVTGSGTLEGIAPGTYKVAAFKDGSVVYSTIITFESGKTTNVIQLGKEAVTDKIILHAYGYTHVYAWKDENTKYAGKWPGTAMTQEGTSGWYVYTLEGITSSSVVFNNSGANQTADLLRDAAGEYWYKDNKWYDSNPDRPQKPVVKISLASGIYTTSQKVTLSSTNGDDIIFYTLDGSEPTVSSIKYTDEISISSSCTLKAFGYNPEAETATGDVVSAVYTIDANADVEPPVIVANKTTGRYKEAISGISFTITDNKNKGFTVYYTTDGSVPSTSSDVYAECAAGYYSVTGNSLSVALNSNMTVRMLAVDKAGNVTGPKAFYYSSSNFSYVANRWDPRQESIYFLLTARWFDGNAANTIGDENCSWTEARANDDITDDGFTGPEDVTWRGDFEGLVEKMDYIKSLGFTCIWLTPIVQNRSPLCYHGYHAWDMYKEDARLVSEGYDFQRVIDEAHKRDMKICLDIVINHSGRFGLKDFAEIKYNRGHAAFVTPKGWENFTYDENAYQNAYKVIKKTGITGGSQNFPNNWEYDGLTSPGLYPDGYKLTNSSGWSKDVGGTAIPGYVPFNKDCRPFTAEDISAYPALNDTTKYCWPTTESYCRTIDGMGTTGSLTLEEYKTSKRRLRGHNTGFPIGSSSFDNFPDANLDSLHEDCPDLNIENPEVQDYIIGAYNRYIDMGVDMFRVDTVMHMTKETLNDFYWPRLMEEAATSKAVEARGGADFFIFGEVGNFVNNLSDKPVQLRQSNYVWNNSVSGPLAGSGASNNHALNGNEYRTINKANKAVENSDYVVSVIDIISHNGFCDGVGGAYGRALSNSDAYWDSTYLTWYTDSHDYGPNKGETRWKGDFAAAWSMLFTFRGIPIVYYGSEIQFAAGKPNDWPGGGGNGVNMSLEKTGRSYYGPNLEGTVTASGFGEYEASGKVASTLSSDLSKHLRDLNRIRIAVPALQMGQYSTEGHTGGWAGYKRRYTGKNKITGEDVDSYALVGVGSGTHSWTGVLAGEYVDIISGTTVNAAGGNITVSAHGSDDAALVVLVKKGLATEAPGKVCKESPKLGF